MTATRLAAALVLLATAPVAAQRTADVQRRLQESQSQLTDLRRERQQLEDALGELRGRAHDLTEEISNLERQRNATARLVRALDQQMFDLASESDRVTTDLVLAENALYEKRAVLRRRLVEIYQRGPLHAVEVLFAAESFGDLLSRYKYLYLVSRQDRQIVRDVEALHDRIADQRSQLLGIQRQVARAREERAGELDRFERLERQRQRSLTETRATERRTAERLSALAADEQRLTDLVARLERERRATAARGGDPGAPAPAITTSDIGTLDWPVRGSLIYRYGSERLEAGGAIVWHGIGIRAPVGTPVRAVRAGRVRHSGPLNTYRTTVIIEHGGGFYSVYAYLQDAIVRLDQSVTEGQIIGHVGDSVDRGPRLHFELREGNVTLDPLTWLRRQ